MLRLSLLSILLLACGGEKRHVSTFRMPHGGTCPDDKGCEAPFVTEAQYASPDSSRPPPDPSTVPAVVNAKAPEPDCTLVGEELASLEVGNYADEATRAPAVAKHEARCRSEALTLEERQCILQSQPPHRYSWGAARNPSMTAWCAQRMFPNLPAVQLVPVTKCSQIEAAVRVRVPKQQLAADQRRAWDAKMQVLATSCQQDRWTAEFGQCVEKNSYPLEPLATCFTQAPYPLQLKIAERNDKAVRAVATKR